LTKEEIQARLDKLPPRPWTFVKVSNDERSVTGTLRASDGRALMINSPETMGMAQMLPEVAEFLRDSADIIERLLKEDEKS
jgi:hypothetical protein